MTDVLFDCPGHGVARIVINRPQARNAMSSAVRQAIAAALAQAEADPAIGAIILTATGCEAFSASLDIKELRDNPQAVRDAMAPDPRFNTALAVERCSKPIIGAINGVCISGGLEVALACDMLIASEDARFADFHIRVGHLPAWGLSQRLSRVIGPGRAREMSFTGSFIDAATAEKWGLVNRVVPHDRLQEEALALAGTIAAHDLRTLRATKQLMASGEVMHLADALAFERAFCAEFLAGTDQAN